MSVRRPLYAYATEGAVEGHYVTDPVTKGLTLCNKPLVWVPLVQAPPAVLHWNCMDLVRRGALPAMAPEPELEAPTDGVCPDCGELVALDAAGLLIPHTVTRTKTAYAPCDGAGQRPEDDE